MANIDFNEKYAGMREKLLVASAELFLTKGYSLTTMREITEKSGVDKNALIRIFGNKDNILAALVKYVLEGQFAKTSELLEGVTDDKILFYAAETTLQLHIVESNPYIRELYSAAYSLPATTDIIQHTITGKLENIFKEHLPHLETKDFFELEIASGGIMRGFMTVPCDLYFTMERKVKRFLETTFLVYEVPKEKIKEAIEFVKQFDFEKIAKETIDTLLDEITSKA